MEIEGFSEEVSLELGELYESNVERTKFVFELCKQIYNLPTVTATDEVTPELFAYCEHRDFFVNVVAYLQDRIFLRRAVGNTLTWELPGSAVKAQGNETIQDAALRIIKRDITGIDIGELRPIAHVEKKYRNNGREVVHHGLTFLGRARNVTIEDVVSNDEIKGRFVSITNVEELARIPGTHRELCDVALPVIRTATEESTTPLERELVSSSLISSAGRFAHERLVGPLGRYFSSRKLKREILKYLPECRTFIDVACGDDTFIFDVAKDVAICVGNDIHWGQVTELMQRSLRPRNVVFFNHDACDLTFAVQYFDVALCKNMIHHMTNRDQLHGLLTSLKKAARRIIIVDPESPETSGFLARIWHWWYVSVLKDQGDRFLRFDQLKKILGDFFRAASIKCFKVKTIKGNYMFAIIDLPGTN